ncbi:MAG: C4-type zinc ribbon domain-containing protein [Elusimicrobiota bacterium]|nr:C4-type zinc ribbon domain-containing protein [Elusimicrobiota bacterium]
MSGIHTTEIKLLVKLQEKDSAIDAVNKKIKAFPGEIEAVKEEFEEKKNVMEEAKKLLSGFQVEKKDKEILMAQREEDIKKHQRELNMVKENNAFKALLIEIERDKEGRDVLETDILVLLDKIDKETVEVEVSLKEFKKEEEISVLKIKELEDAKKKNEADKELMVEERGKLALKVNEEMLSRYERIRAGKGVAIVQAHEEDGKYSCGGCNMALVSQSVVDVKKKDSFGICDNCQRMLYLKKVVLDS